VRPRLLIAALVCAAVVVAACSSSSKSSSSASGGTTGLGVGVTATTVKVGIALVDFSCIQQFVDSIRTNQDQVYGAFVNDINQHGGINGRKIVPDFRTYCPLTSAAALTLCTQFTEDDHVFAVMGNFNDFSGDAQTCVAKNHNTPLIAFNLTEAQINQSPPGMIIFPGAAAERIDSVLISLLQKSHTLAGKKIAVLGEVKSQAVVNSSVLPGLRKLGVPMGSTAILSISGADTSAAQAQLDSFLEKWKSEGVNALYVSGEFVNSKQFIEKVRQQMPNVLLVTDIADDLMFAQQEQTAGRKPNPYEGVIFAGGPTTVEYNKGPNWAYCAKIYQQQLGKPAPDGETVIPGPNGKTLDTYGLTNDSCQMVTLFHDIAQRVGTNLNVANWTRTVNSYGTIRNMGGGPYASLHQGKYDIDDSFRLESYDSSLGAKGDWKALTPLQDITGR
jgi:ABC-type branched-subunit amino acid transport system substrate-binding protein